VVFNEHLLTIILGELTIILGELTIILGELTIILGELTIILGELTLILGELLVIYELVVQLLHIFNSNTYFITFSSVMLIDYSLFSSIPVMLFDYSLFSSVIIDYSLFSSVIIINNSLFVSNAHRLFTFFISNY